MNQSKLMPAMYWPCLPSAAAAWLALNGSWPGHRGGGGSPGPGREPGRAGAGTCFQGESRRGPSNWRRGPGPAAGCGGPAVGVSHRGDPARPFLDAAVPVAVDLHRGHLPDPREVLLDGIEVPGNGLEVGLVAAVVRR